MTSKQTRRGAEIVATLLAGAGVTRVYGNPDGRTAPLWTALSGAGIETTAMPHERGAAFMADVHARVTEGIGVVMTASAAGTIAALAGAAAASSDAVPLLLITVQADSGRHGGDRGSGIQAMIEATTKDSLHPKRVEDLASMVTKAIDKAQAVPAGPVHLDIPADLFGASAHVRARWDAPAPGPHGTGPNVSLDPVHRVAHALRHADRPLILAGGGLRSAAAARQLLELARRCDVPVAGTLAAKGHLDERHPLVLGPVGRFGRTAANVALGREADLVLALGVSAATIGWMPALTPERLIRVDVDRGELSKGPRAGTAIAADAGAFLDVLGRADANIAGNGRARVRTLLERHRDEVPISWRSPDGRAHPIEVCDAINRSLGDARTTLVADGGPSAHWVERHLRTRGHDRFVVDAGLGTMGHGVAGGLGAWHGRTDIDGPGERVIVTTGADSFLASIPGVSAAVAAGAAITYVIFDDGDDGPAVLDVPRVSYVDLARSLGADGRKVIGIDEIDAGLHWASTRRGPSVLQALIDPAPIPAPFNPDTNR